MTGGAQPESVWSLTDEREFMESLVCERFNFLLVLFGLIVVGAIEASKQFQLLAVLWLGVLTIVPISATIAGAHWKLEWILKKIHEDPSHTITIVSAAGSHLNARWLVGYFVPAICAFSTLVGAVLASCGILTVANGS